MANQEMREAIVLIYLNKTDMPGAMTAEELTTTVDYRSPLGHNDLKTTCFFGKFWHLQECSVVTGDGIKEGLEWIIATQP